MQHGWETDRFTWREVSVRVGGWEAVTFWSAATLHLICILSSWSGKTSAFPSLSCSHLLQTSHVWNDHVFLHLMFYIYCTCLHSQLVNFICDLSENFMRKHQISEVIYFWKWKFVHIKRHDCFVFWVIISFIIFIILYFIRLIIFKVFFLWKLWIVSVKKKCRLNYSWLLLFVIHSYYS